MYQEALCRRHYSSILSAAALFRLVSFVLAVVLSFLLAYATGGFWKKVGHEVVQPTVHYSGDGLLILEVWAMLHRCFSGMAERTWNSMHMTDCCSCRHQHLVKSRSGLLLLHWQLR